MSHKKNGKIMEIIAGFATIVIPIVSWEPIKTPLDKLFSNSSFWSSVWVFFSAPRFGFGTIIWVLFVGFLIYKALGLLFKKTRRKERAFIRKTPNQMAVTENLIVKYRIVFEEGQPTPTDVVLFCSVGDCSQQLNHYSHDSCILGFGCSEDCRFKHKQSYHDAVDVIINCVKSELMKDWNGFN